MQKKRLTLQQKRAAARLKKQNYKGRKLTKTSRFDSVINSVRKALSRQISKIGYDFWDEMMNNEIALSAKPEDAAVVWYKTEYRNDPETWLKKGFMKPGRLYMFDYKHPKNEDTLAFWDKNPLVLSLGQFKTKAGLIRNIGINMHLLPPKVRRLVMFTVFTVFKSQYKRNLYADDPRDIPAIRWKTIEKVVRKFGTGFALRMYIPELQKHIIEFKTEDICKAIWIPSAGFVKTNPYKLDKAWKEYLKEHGQIAKIVKEERHRRPI